MQLKKYVLALPGHNDIFGNFTVIQQLFTEVEVASGGYIRTRQESTCRRFGVWTNHER